MYASLYELFDSLFGIKFGVLKVFHTFGALMAISFLVAAWLLSKELKRKEDEKLLKPTQVNTWIGGKASMSELIEAFIIAFLIFFKLIYIVFHFNEFQTEPQGTLISLKGNIIAGLIAGCVYAFLVFREREKKRLPDPKMEYGLQYPHMLVGNITLIAAIGGILGAKLFDILESPASYFENPSTILSGSGLTIYGGLIVGAISVLYYTNKKGIPLLHMVDAAAPAMIMAYAVGRIGCQLAGDGDWGIPNPSPMPAAISFLPHWMWAFNYPHNVEHMGNAIQGCVGECYSDLDPPVFPTPFYETVMGTIIFFILWGMRKKIHAPGVLFCWYLVFNGIERFLIELIRVNIKYDIFGIGITQAQIIAPIFFILGIIGIFYFTKRDKETRRKEHGLA